MKSDMKIQNGKEPFKQKYSDPVIREICHGIKDRDLEALKMMKHFILDDGMIRKGDLIIPAPQHEGKAIYTLKIAEMIAEETGAVVIDILHSQQRKTMHEQKLSGTVSAPLFFADYQNLPRDKRIFFLDNVIDTGTTLKAAEQAVGQKLMPLVYAYTDRAPDNLVEERRNIHMGRDDDIRHDPFRGRIKYQKQYNREDSIFVRVKAAVTVKEAAAFYNVPMDQAGRTKCLFHPDTHPSMKLYDDHYHCFGCQTNGDVIAFAARLFNLRPIDAAKRLANDFGVPIGYLTEQDRENFKRRFLFESS